MSTVTTSSRTARRRVDRGDGERMPVQVLAHDEHRPGSAAGSAIGASARDGDDVRVVEPGGRGRRARRRPRTAPTARRRRRCSRPCRCARRCRTGPDAARRARAASVTSNAAAMRASSEAVCSGSMATAADAGGDRRRRRRRARAPGGRRSRTRCGGKAPGRDGRAIAATIASSCASVLSLPMQSRSQPAARARTAASGMPCTPLAPCMSRASVTMTPSNPSSPRSRPCTMRGERVAGCSASRRGRRMCEVMIVRVPAAMAARNGTSSRSRSVSSGRSTTGRARCESVAVSPCPGKCFALAATPVDWSPRTHAADVRGPRARGRRRSSARR